jgi:hypothetical protein
MTTEKIWKELRLYLPELSVINLKLAYAISPDVQLCLAVSEIVMSYHGRQESEDAICDLLVNLCKNHYNKKPKK